MARAQFQRLCQAKKSATGRLTPSGNRAFSRCVKACYSRAHAGIKLFSFSAKGTVDLARPEQNVLNGARVSMEPRFFQAPAYLLVVLGGFTYFDRRAKVKDIANDPVAL
jgi:hypothetical protein